MRRVLFLIQKSNLHQENLKIFMLFPIERLRIPATPIKKIWLFCILSRAAGIFAERISNQTTKKWNTFIITPKGWRFRHKRSTIWLKFDLIGEFQSECNAISIKNFENFFFCIFLIKKMNLNFILISGI